MATFGIDGTSTLEGSALYDILQQREIVPGMSPSYEICKALYIYHPLGKRVIDSPVARAMSKRREIVVLEAPDVVIERFNAVWDDIRADEFIFDTVRLARIYGIASMAVMPEDGDPERALTPEELYSGNIKINVFDPLNTAGSLVGVLDPLDPNFLKFSSIQVMGKNFHRSRVHLEMNEQPIYLDYSESGFGYVGRSVFTRSLYPLQSYLQTMVSDNLVVTKAGVLVAKVNGAGSMLDNVEVMFNKLRLNILKMARTGNTVNIQPDEDIESLDLHDVDYQDQRKNILETIALSLDMPSSFLTSETLAQGFGEGSEDAKLIANYLDGLRREMKGVYDFMDNLVQYIAWNPEFYLSVQRENPSLAGVSYEEWFGRCRRSFTAIWPEAMEASKKERVEHQKVCYQSVLEAYKTFEPVATGQNKVRLLEWAQANLSELEELFPNKLELDLDEMMLRDALGLDEVDEAEELG